jgi:hypothetical protein
MQRIKFVLWERYRAWWGAHELNKEDPLLLDRMKVEERSKAKITKRLRKSNEQRRLREVELGRAKREQEEAIQLERERQLAATRQLVVVPEDQPRKWEEEREGIEAHKEDEEEEARQAKLGTATRKAKMREEAIRASLVAETLELERARLPAALAESAERQREEEELTAMSEVVESEVENETTNTVEEPQVLKTEVTTESETPGGSEAVQSEVTKENEMSEESKLGKTEKSEDPEK